MKVAVDYDDEGMYTGFVDSIKQDTENPTSVTIVFPDDGKHGTAASDTPPARGVGL